MYITSLLKCKLSSLNLLSSSKLNNLICFIRLCTIDLLTKYVEEVICYEDR